MIAQHFKDLWDLSCGSQDPNDPDSEWYHYVRIPKIPPHVLMSYLVRRVKDINDNSVYFTRKYERDLREHEDAWNEKIFEFKPEFHVSTATIQESSEAIYTVILALENAWMGPDLFDVPLHILYRKYLGEKEPEKEPDEEKVGSEDWFDSLPYPPYKLTEDDVDHIRELYDELTLSGTSQERIERVLDHKIDDILFNK